MGPWSFIVAPSTELFSTIGTFEPSCEPFRYAKLVDVGKGVVAYHRDPSDGSPRFDVVILDAPATGHSLDMVSLPRTILEVVPLDSPPRRRTRLGDAHGLCGDSVVLVTLAEDMPVSETLELARGLGQIGLPVDRVVVNSVVPPLFSMDERRSLESLDLSRSEDAGEAVLAACRQPCDWRAHPV